jgi:hypothetical protein
VPDLPLGQCRPGRHGTYLRKLPTPARVARFYCADTGTTIGLLPDFYASRMRGTLLALEAAANELRPGDVDEAVTLPTAMRWVRLRLARVRATLATVRGLMPARFERCQITVRSVRAELGTPAC